MLVLALEFSRGVPARGARLTATDNRGETGAYGASGRRGRTEAASPEGTQGSFPQNGRARPGGHGRLDPLTDGLPTIELHEEHRPTLFRGWEAVRQRRRMTWTPSSQCSTSVVVDPTSGRRHSLERR